MQVSHQVRDPAELAALYPAPVARVWAKESTVVTPGYATLIAAAPFAVLATHGPQGIDCSPRGDKPGFVQVADGHTLLVPDRRGNNRLDTLRNLLADPTIALIFLIPGVGEAIRVRGTAVISTDPALLARFEVQGTLPTTVLVVTVSRIYFQCQRAILRSGLWDAGRQVDRASLPTAGQLLVQTGALTGPDAAEYDHGLAEHAAATLYAEPTKS